MSDGDTNYFSDINGIIYNDFTSIICYPSGNQSTTFVITSTVISIGEAAFGGCSYLETVTIGENMEI